jgi:cytochrome c553
MEKVMIVPRAEGDIENGKGSTRRSASPATAATGRGRGKFPMLVGQYTNYLKKQVDAYLKGERPHDEEGTTGILNRITEKDIQDILAYLTSIQDIPRPPKRNDQAMRMAWPGRGRSRRRSRCTRPHPLRAARRPSPAD